MKHFKILFQPNRDDLGEKVDQAGVKQNLEREIIDETESSDDDDDATDTAQEEEEEEEQEEYVDMENEDFVKDSNYSGKGRAQTFS